VSRRVYWPVYWHEIDEGPEHIAFLDDEKVARMMVEMFKVLGVKARVNPPVHLSVFDTFLKDWA
jgi:hypothetical protein